MFETALLAMVVATQEFPTIPPLPPLCWVPFQVVRIVATGSQGVFIKFTDPLPTFQDF